MKVCAVVHAAHSEVTQTARVGLQDGRMLECASLRGDKVQYRHVVVRRTGGPEVLEVVDDELPEPGPRQARVKILAADVSFSDVNVRRGRYPGAPRPPFTPGYAMFGVVERLGAGASGMSVGQHVAALTFFGSYSEFICLPVEELVPMPTGLDPAEAVTLVLNYVAAYQMLQRVARVQRGQQILVHGAGGGVGTALVQLGRLAGAEVYGTASSGKKELLRRLGATPIDYRKDDFVERVMSATGGIGVDAAFDPLGARHLRRSVRAVRKGGAVVAFGYYEAANRGRSAVRDVLSQYLRLAWWSLPPRRKHAVFYDIRPQKKKHPERFRQDLMALSELLAKGEIHPVIAARFPLDDVVTAHRQVENAEVLGKVVLLPSAER